MKSRDRKPFFIHTHAIAKIDIYEPVNHDTLLAFWRTWDEEYDAKHEERFDNLLRAGAKELIEQLEGRQCVRFIEYLRDECDKIVEGHKKQVRENKDEVRT